MKWEKQESTKPTTKEIVIIHMNKISLERKGWKLKCMSERMKLKKKKVN